MLSCPEKTIKTVESLARCSVVLILMIIAQRRVKTIGHRHPTSYLDLYRQLTNELLKDILQSPRICFYLFFMKVVKSTMTLKKFVSFQIFWTWKYISKIKSKPNTFKQPKNVELHNLAINRFANSSRVNVLNG